MKENEAIRERFLKVFADRLNGGNSFEFRFMNGFSYIAELEHFIFKISFEKDVVRVQSKKVTKDDSDNAVKEKPFSEEKTFSYIDYAKRNVSFPALQYIEAQNVREKSLDDKNPLKELSNDEILQRCLTLADRIRTIELIDDPAGRRLFITNFRSEGQQLFLEMEFRKIWSEVKMKAEIDDIAAHKDVGIFREAVRSAEADFVEGKGSREEVERARAAYLNKSLEAFKEPIPQWDKVYKLSALRDYFPSVR